MEDGEAPVECSSTATATATATAEEEPAAEGEDVVKMEVKAEDDIVKEEDIGDEIIEMGDLKEHYDQDVQVNNKGSIYRVTLVLVKDQIRLPGPDSADEWCNLPYESLRALDSATLAFVRLVSTPASTNTCVFFIFLCTTSFSLSLPFVLFHFASLVTCLLASLLTHYLTSFQFSTPFPFI